MDISDTLQPASDQLDAIDLVAGERTFTVKGVRKGSAEQPVQVDLVEFDRPWRPGKNMRRVLAHIWGNDASKWTGNRVTLYRDAEVTFGKDKPGGTRIRAMSGITTPAEVPLLVSRGKTATYTVEPLPDDAPAAAPSREEWEARIASSTSIEELRSWWQLADPAARNLIEARVADLQAAQDQEADA